jgi:hypothetical protein
MTPVLVGQLLGMSFACGLNLYATVAALGLLSRIGIIGDLPPGLRGLESTIVIASALVLYLVEAVADRIRNLDSVWDTVHVFIRPPAAALLAIGALWGYSPQFQLAAAAFALGVAFAAHGTKAGLRLALNASGRNGNARWLSTAEDLAAIAFATAALEYPATALAAGAAVLLLIAPFAPRLWRAAALGLRCVAAWFRALFVAPAWRDIDAVPRRLRDLLDDTPLGTAPPRVTRASLTGMRGVGAYRNGWLVATAGGPVFLYQGALGPRRVDLPRPRRVQSDPGLWVNTLRVEAEPEPYTIHLLKDGPAADLARLDLGTVAS